MNELSAFSGCVRQGEKRALYGPKTEKSRFGSSCLRLSLNLAAVVISSRSCFSSAMQPRLGFGGKTLKFIEHVLSNNCRRWSKSLHISINALDTFERTARASGSPNYCEMECFWCSHRLDRITRLNYNCTRVERKVERVWSSAFGSWKQCLLDQIIRDSYSTRPSCIGVRSIASWRPIFSFTRFKLAWNFRIVDLSFYQVNIVVFGEMFITSGTCTKWRLPVSSGTSFTSFISMICWTYDDLQAIISLIDLHSNIMTINDCQLFHSDLQPSLRPASHPTTHESLDGHIGKKYWLSKDTGAFCLKTISQNVEINEKNQE